jgi:hypothetical protein
MRVGEGDLVFERCTLSYLLDPIYAQAASSLVLPLGLVVSCPDLYRAEVMWEDGYFECLHVSELETACEDA